MRMPAQKADQKFPLAGIMFFHPAPSLNLRIICKSGYHGLLPVSSGTAQTKKAGQRRAVRPLPGGGAGCPAFAGRGRVIPRRAGAAPAPHAAGWRKRIFR